MGKQKRAVLGIFAFLNFFLLTQFVYAETYYVAPNGEATWNEAQNIDTPCSVYTAMENARAGDTVLFRGGTYNFPYAYKSTWIGIIHPFYSGTADNPIVFKAYPDETPIWNVTGTPEGGYTTLFSTAGHEYIVLDGFTVMANNGTAMTSVAMHGDTGIEGPYKKGCIVQNMTINGGGVFTGNNNREGIRVDDMDGAIIRNNTIYGYNGNNNPNYAGIKFYNDSNCIAEHNEIRNCIRGIYSKSKMCSTVIRFNYIRDVSIGIMDASYSSTTVSHNNTIHDNLIVNASYVGIRWLTEVGFSVNGNKFYNNTLYNCKHGINIGDGSGWQVYNNIISRTSKGHHVNIGVIYSISKFDHNLYDNNQSFFIQTHFEGVGGVDYTSLSSWQSSGELEGGDNPGVGSYYADPQFENSSGTMTDALDYKLSSSSPGYRQGVGGVDIGANVDLVGLRKINSKGSPPSNPGRLRTISE